MRKLKFVTPCLTVIASLPIVSLVACNNETKYDLFKIDLDKIQDIVSLKDVQFLQDDVLTYGPGGTQWCKEWMSPTVFYTNVAGDIEMFERFVYLENDKTMEIDRKSFSPVDWSAPYETTNPFRTPSILGNAFIGYCYSIKNSNASLTFNKDKLCYETSFVEHETTTNSYEFYFLNNRLVKCVNSFKLLDSEVGGTMEYILTYDEKTPVLPITPQY